MTDAEIIDLFVERSEQAISELASKHGKAVARVAGNILADKRDSEEVINDTWLGVWNSIPPQRPSPLRTYVCRIARNLATT
ncbi:MAG: recombinase, partial [Oscillospiraceae bacterium]|nr:recombinase [Oscillospiraceae bacterium]